MNGGDIWSKQNTAAKLAAEKLVEIMKQNQKSGRDTGQLNNRWQVIFLHVYFESRNNSMSCMSVKQIQRQVGSDWSSD